MKSARTFYSSSAALNLIIMFVGFMPFCTNGHGQHGRIIAPVISLLVSVHGLAITAWYVLSLVQSLLIAMVVTYLGAEQLSRTDTWRHLAGVLLRS